MKCNMNKTNIIQFLPYFPPHKWWLETVAQELVSFYVAWWYGNVINVVFDVWQDYHNEKYEYIFNQNNEKIGYKQNGYIVYLLPAFDIIPNFPVPKFWKKEFWEVLKIINPSLILPLNLKEGDNNEKYIVQTHTRFFLSSLLWWLFAKYYKLKWVHIEHGSDYVKLWSKFKSKISYIYDRIIWAWIFAYADKIVAISEACKKFIVKEFVDREVEVIYNGIYFEAWEKKYNWEEIKIWFVWRLVKLKWVDLLLNGFKNLSKKYFNLELEIVWDWDERKKLEDLVLKLWIQNKIRFLWIKNREEVASFLSSCDILVNPSYQEWLPTTVLEWLLSWCVVIATDVWGTKEISESNDLIIVEKWNISSIEKWLEEAILNYKEIRWKSGEMVKEKFDWNENIKKYFILYNSL